VLDIAALLNDLEEPPQFRFGKQLRQLALLLCPAQAQLPAGLLGNVEEIVVVEPRFAGDADELRHDFGFRFFLWRYEVDLERKEQALAHCEVTKSAPTKKWREDASDRKSTRLNSSHLGISYAVF